MEKVSAGEIAVPRLWFARLSERLTMSASSERHLPG